MMGVVFSFADVGLWALKGSNRTSSPILYTQSIHADIHIPYMHACMHACIHAYMHTCIHADMHTCIHTSFTLLFVYFLLS